MNINKKIDFAALAIQIKTWGKSLGFQQIGIADTDLTQADKKLKQWLAKRFHGSMSYLERNLDLRAHPEKLVPNTITIITARMNYFPTSSDAIKVLKDNRKAYVSRYALGRDYHKLVRKRLNLLAKKITDLDIPLTYRAFADSAPVFEKPLAEKSGLGWMGKNTLILNRQAGSWFFLGTLFTNLPLPIDAPVTNHCGSCTACMDVCPTKAIVAPYVLNATRCISYLTIENKGPIPMEFRKAIGNRIFGCDDCQLFCPWNKFAKITNESDFSPRHQLDHLALTELFSWSESEFLKKTEGSAIRRAGYIGWLRNIAVALGNANTNPSIIHTLKQRKDHASELVREHVAWALKSHSAQ